MIVEAVYKPPQVFDVSGLLRIARSRKSAADDSLIGLREDPGYFLATLQDPGEHAPDNIPNAFGRTIRKSDQFWHKALVSLSAKDYCSILLWDQVCLRLKAILDVLPTKLNTFKPLPQKVEAAFHELRRVVKLHTGSMVRDIHHGLAGSPPFRS